MRAGLDLQQYLYNPEHFIELPCDSDAHWSRNRVAGLMHMQINGLTCTFQKAAACSKQVTGGSSFLNVTFVQLKCIFFHIFG